MKVSFQNRCNTGEYYLASILSARNCNVTVTLGRGELFDLLVVNPKGNTIKIQVKTTFGLQSMFYDEKSEKLKNVYDDMFYAFIKYDNDRYDFWILSSKELYDYSVFVHKAYHSYPKRDGTPRKDSSMRKFNVGKKNKYETDDWEEKLKLFYKNLKPILEF